MLFKSKKHTLSTDIPPGRPCQHHKATSCCYQIEARLVPNQAAIAIDIQRAGRFILATNVVNSEKISFTPLCARPIM